MRNHERVSCQNPAKEAKQERGVEQTRYILIFSLGICSNYKVTRLQDYKITRSMIKYFNCCLHGAA